MITVSSTLLPINAYLLLQERVTSTHYSKHQCTPTGDITVKLVGKHKFLISFRITGEGANEIVPANQEACKSLTAFGVTL